MTLDLQITGSYRSPRSAREWEMRGARFTESSSRSHSEGETSREACITGAPASGTVYKAIRFAAAVDTAERTRVKRRSFSDCSHSLTVCGAISGDRSPWCGNLFISVLDTPGAVSWETADGDLDRHEKRQLARNTTPRDMRGRYFASRCVAVSEAAFGRRRCEGSSWAATCQLFPVESATADSRYDCRSSASKSC
jgi:hypothetical protein